MVDTIPRGHRDEANAVLAQLGLDVLANVQARDRDPALADASWRQFLHTVSALRREDPAARARRLGPDAWRVTVAPSKRPANAEERARQLWRLIEYLSGVVGTVEASTRPDGAVDLRGWVTRRDPAEPSLVEALWGQICPHMAPLVPAQLQELGDVPDTVALAIRLYAMVWNVTDESIERHLLPRVRTLAREWDARRRWPPGAPGWGDDKNPGTLLP